MIIGDLKKRIALEYPTNTPDGMGGSTRTWTTAASGVPAAIWPASVAEITRAGGTGMVHTHRIRIRYMEGVLGSWRVRFGDRYFNIVSIINANEENRVLDLLAKEAT